MKKNKHDIQIDESSHKSAPNILTRLKHTFQALGMAVILAQVLLFAFRYGSIVLWWDHAIFHIYLVVCSILGWFFGERFIETLGEKSGNWWDLGGFFRSK
jgi:hypothetical protein